MKKIITTVGTSLIANGLINKDISNSNYEVLKGKPYQVTTIYPNRVESIKSQILEIIQKNDFSISAEIASLIKIAKELKEPLEVYLIATDTILSAICAGMIKKWFENAKTKNGIEHIKLFENIYFEANSKFIIPNLQVKNRNHFEREGLTNLYNRINEIAENGHYWDNCILNITGGYKAIIPYMSIIAQINSIPAFYNFQEVKDEKFDLITIPDLPLSIDYSLFEKYWSELTFVETKGEYINDFQFQQDMKNLLEPAEGKSQMLTMLGYALWEKYKSRYFKFLCPDDVWKQISQQNNILRIIKTKFWNITLRDSKTESKQEHLVFDDGNNNNRIYYFLKDGLVYIYKTFENEKNAKAFINTKIDYAKIVSDANPRKIEIQK